MVMKNGMGDRGRVRMEGKKRRYEGFAIAKKGRNMIGRKGVMKITKEEAL